MILNKEKTESNTSLKQVHEPGKREVYFDCLRIMATFVVIMAHLAAQNWYTVEVGTYEWNVFNLYDAIARWSVPVFVMISGALFLGAGSKNPERIFKKNIPRIITAFLFWSAIYAISNLFLGKSEWKNAIREFVEGPTHLWFLFMIAGLYMLVPLLWKITENEKLTGYFVLLSLVFTFVLPFCVTVISLYSEKFGAIAGGLVGNIGVTFTAGYVSYFVCGYYLSRRDMDRKRRGVIYLLGIAGLAVTFFAARIFPASDEAASSIFHDCMIFNVMLTGVALFVFAKNSGKIRNVSDRTREWLEKLSNYSFGVYLVHILVARLLDHNPLFELDTLQFKVNLLHADGIALNPLISVPVNSVIVFVISVAISGILHRIPVLKKYVV